MRELSLPGAKMVKSNYSLIKRFQLLEIEVAGDLVTKLVKANTTLRYVHIEETFDLLHEMHVATGHGGRDILIRDVKKKFANITIEQIMWFLELCQFCQLKRSKTRKEIVVKSIVSTGFNNRAQVDLIDMQSQPDGEYRFIMNYQDHGTKFGRLLPLKTKTAVEVAENICDIFCLMDAPQILHSDNGREFVNQVIRELVELFPGCKLVNGKPRHSQSQGSV